MNRIQELNLPSDTVTDEYQGAVRYRFTFEGREAWIVAGNNVMEERYFFWVPEWPCAFPERNGVKELLKLGYIMVHIHIRGLCGGPEAVEIMKRFYDFLLQRGFARKAAMIGMSLGGLYSLRYAATYPESVACIYADAPACDLYYRHRLQRADTAEICLAYGVREEESSALIEHKLSPLCNYRPIVKGNIPILLILGGADTVVPPELNGRLFAERFREAGGNILVNERMSWGHHPHGLDDPTPIVQFILKNTLNCL